MPRIRHEVRVPSRPMRTLIGRATIKRKSAKPTARQLHESKNKVPPSSRINMSSDKRSRCSLNIRDPWLTVGDASGSGFCESARLISWPERGSRGWVLLLASLSSVWRSATAAKNTARNPHACTSTLKPYTVPIKPSPRKSSMSSCLLCNSPRSFHTTRASVTPAITPMVIPPSVPHNTSTNAHCRPKFPISCRPSKPIPSITNGKALPSFMPASQVNVKRSWSRSPG